MTSIMQKILQDSKCVIKELDKKILLFQGNSINYLEDYIEIEKLINKYEISEIHRNVKRAKIESKNEDEAIVYAVVLWKRLYDDITDRRVARDIRRYIELGEEKKVIDYIGTIFDKSIYSIGKEEDYKISFIKSANKVNVMYNGEYLAENATLSRGYVVLYNYCGRMVHISSFLNEIQNKINFTLSYKRLIRLYILGK